jgi:Holliday junction resolvasome RuvABC endonuclease subunit
MNISSKDARANGAVIRGMKPAAARTPTRRRDASAWEAPPRPGGLLLAIDPSITAAGWAIVSPSRTRIASGTFKPSAAQESPDRFDQLADFVRMTISSTGVTDVLIETPSGGQRHSAMQLMTYARAIGVCEASARCAGVAVWRASVNQWKGTAPKASTLIRVRAAFMYEPKDHNECDALGLALAWLERTR